MHTKGITIIKKYFPQCTELQYSQFAEFEKQLRAWNAKINLISRKDEENITIHHILHSLSIAKVASFLPKTHILDAGTGGGLPGIPLAILFPHAQFTLIDSIGKKIRATEGILQTLGMKNVRCIQTRVEAYQGNFDILISRATVALATLCQWAHGKQIFALKGGDISKELSDVQHHRPTVYPISDLFEENYFQNKYIVLVQES